MKTQGYIRQTYTTEGRNYVLLEVDGLPVKTEEKQSISFGKVTKQRSMDANAYHWVLCGKIATAVKTDAQSVHYDLMVNYGTPYLDEDGIPVVAQLPAYADLKSLDGVYGRMLKKDGAMVRYLLIKPSRLYTSAEMAALIEGTITEAKELGIETLTPQELRSMGL